MDELDLLGTEGRRQVVLVRLSGDASFGFRDDGPNERNAFTVARVDAVGAAARAGLWTGMVLLGFKTLAPTTRTEPTPSWSATRLWAESSLREIEALAPLHLVQLHIQLTRTTPDHALRKHAAGLRRRLAPYQLTADSKTQWQRPLDRARLGAVPAVYYAYYYDVAVREDPGGSAHAAVAEYERRLGLPPSDDVGRTEVAKAAFEAAVRDGNAASTQEATVDEEEEETKEEEASTSTPQVDEATRETSPLAGDGAVAEQRPVQRDGDSEEKEEREEEKEAEIEDDAELTFVRVEPPDPACRLIGNLFERWGCLNDDLRGCGTVGMYYSRRLEAERLDLRLLSTNEPSRGWTIGSSSRAGEYTQRGRQIERMQRVLSEAAPANGALAFPVAAIRQATDELLRLLHEAEEAAAPRVGGRKRKRARGVHDD